VGVPKRYEGKNGTSSGFTDQKKELGGLQKQIGKRGKKQRTAKVNRGGGLSRKRNRAGNTR